MDRMQKLHTVDKRLQGAVRRRFKAEFYDRGSEDYSPNNFISGSAVEVGMLCRSLPKREFEIEYDVMIPIGSLTRDMGRRYLREVKGDAGYVTLLPSPNGEYLYPDDREYLRNPYDDDELWYDYLSVFTDTDNHVVDTALMKESRESHSRGKHPANVHGVVSDGPSNASESLLIDTMQHLLTTSLLLFCFCERTTSVKSVDEVLCFHLNYVPDCIVSWVSHCNDVSHCDNSWPSKETIMEIINSGFHIVAKNVSDKVNTWRLSTSKAETTLFNSMCELQNFSYFLFKTLFYCHIKCIKWYNEKN